MNYAAQNKRIQNACMYILECHDIMMLHALQNEFGFGRTRLKRALSESAKLVHEYEMYYSDEQYPDEREEAASHMRTAYYGAAGDLKASAGLDFLSLASEFPLKLPPLRAFSGKSGKQNPEARERRKTLAYMDFITNVADVMLLLYMHQDEHFGAERLRRLYTAVRTEWLDFAKAFMRDRSQTEWHDRRVTELKQRGIDLQKLYDEIAKEVKDAKRPD